MKARAVGLLRHIMPGVVQMFVTRVFTIMVHLANAFSASIKVILWDYDEVFRDFEDSHVSKWNGSWQELKVPRPERKNQYIELDVLRLYTIKHIAQVLGENQIQDQVIPGRRNDRRTLVRRALRVEALKFILEPGFFLNLKPIPENIEQVRRILRLTRTLKRCPECRKRYPRRQVPDDGYCSECGEPLIVPRYINVIVTKLPSASETGANEKIQTLKEDLGEDYDLLHTVFIATGRKGDKTLISGDLIFDDAMSIKGHVRAKHFVHIRVDATHNMHLDLSLLQRRVTRGGDWIKEARIRH